MVYPHNEILCTCQLKNTQCRSCELGFPGGTVAENLPANFRGHGLDPWSRKIPYALGQLGPCTIIAGAHVL